MIMSQTHGQRTVCPHRLLYKVNCGLVIEMYIYTLCKVLSAFVIHFVISRMHLYYIFIHAAFYSSSLSLAFYSNKVSTIEFTLSKVNNVSKTSLYYYRAYNSNRQHILIGCIGCCW